MAKTRAQRKAERRRREQQQQARQKQQQQEESEAQHDTQVPESPDVAEAELAEQGADLDSLREPAPEQGGAAPEAPAPSRADVGAPGEELSRKERRQAERERKRRAKESEQRRQPRAGSTERRRSGVLAFISQVAAELRRVQWPDRPHLVQASAVTLVFIAILAAYLGGIDAVFNWLVQRIL